METTNVIQEIIEPEAEPELQSVGNSTTDVIKEIIEPEAEPEVQSVEITDVIKDAPETKVR